MVVVFYYYVFRSQTSEKCIHITFSDLNIFIVDYYVNRAFSYLNLVRKYHYSCSLSTATIEYSYHLCVCLCLSVCLCTR